MESNPVIEMLGRRLRLAVIGGGPGSFIGAMHRAAARLDDRYEIVAGVLSSDPERSATAAAGLGITPDRAYATAESLFAEEEARQDGADVVAIMTPNDSHHSYAVGALRHGFDVICDKPITNTLAEAVDVLATVEDTALVLGSAIADALGDRTGIRRYGSATIPMDEAVATAVVDIGGRPYAVIDLPFTTERLGALGTQMIPHALEAFARTAGCTLNISATGSNDHHIAEAAFKALAYAIRFAVEIDPRRSGLASTKGAT